MGALDDHYGLLGVRTDADAAEIRRAFRRLALRFHPDRAGPGGAETFQRLMAAYRVLADPLARIAYDRRTGVARRPIAPASPAARAAPPVALARLSGPLNALLACGAVRRAEEGVVELLLNAQEASEGGMVTIAMRVPARCDACKGGDPSCGRCEGAGVTDELFSAWLAVSPGTTDGTLLEPSAQLRGAVRPVQFRARVRPR